MTPALSSVYPIVASLSATRCFPLLRLSRSPIAHSPAINFAERRAMSWSVVPSPTLAFISSDGRRSAHKWTDANCSRFQSQFHADSASIQRRIHSLLPVPHSITNACRTARGLSKPSAAGLRFSSLSVNARQAPSSVDVSADAKSQQDDNNGATKLPALQFHNSMTHQKEALQPLREGHVGMYVCGITSYDYCHIGHARVYTTFDVLYR